MADTSFKISSPSEHTSRAESSAAGYVVNIDDSISSDVPTGFVAIACTKIQDSAVLWEEIPNSMLEATRIHDDIIRFNCQQFEGYEAEVLNSAFELAFKSAKAALQFCLRVQTDLIAANWPGELLSSPYCQQERDEDYNLIQRGLSVNMSIHWGQPICKLNTLTGRTDYVGPVVHRALKAVEAAGSGQIVVTENFLNEFEGAARNHAKVPRIHPKGLGLGLNGEELEDGLPQRSLPKNAQPGPSKLVVPEKPRQQAFAMKSCGEYQPKGLLEPTRLYAMVPASLSGRLKRNTKSEEPTGIKGWWEWAKEGVASNAAEQSIIPL